MEERLKELRQEALLSIERAADLKELNDIRVSYLGKKGQITSVLKGMGKLSPEKERAENRRSRQ